MSRVDRILNIIDTGLQTTTSLAHHGTDFHTSVCWRCRKTATIDKLDTCGPCRDELTAEP